MKAKFLAAVTLTIAASGLANAADLPPPPVYKSPPPPVTYNWTGCYVGGGAGYGWWTQDSFVQLGGAPITASTTNGGKGWFGQGQGGCNFQFNNPLVFNIPW
jgi:outer membrane immunogenic protein